MSFIAGRITCCSFAVTGDAPKTIDDTLLAILADHAFCESEIGAPDEVEAGFITGQHLLDVDFTYEKCGFGDGGHLLLFAMRLDTHKVPAEVRDALRKQHVQAAAAGNPSGFASKAQKRDAIELTNRDLHADLAAGKFRRSKIVPLLWDLSTKMIYCGATSQAAHEQLVRLMHDSFGLELQIITAGVAASRYLGGLGLSRDVEDLQPTPFTAPPAGVEGQSFPVVPWVAKSVDLKDFLGNEFLIWLWHHAETDEDAIFHFNESNDICFTVFDRYLDMDCAWDIGGKAALRGNGPTRLAEATDALITGKWPRKVGLIVSDGEYQWELTLQGDRMAVSGLKLPPIDSGTSPREIIETRIFHMRKLLSIIDGLYRSYLSGRTSSNWPSSRQLIKQWITDKKPAAVN